MSLRVFFIILFTISYMFGQNEFNIRQLRYIDDTYNVKGQSKPVNGIVYDIKNEKKIIMGSLKNGKKHGLWTEWHPRGRRLQETYKNGLLDGSVSLFYKNGQREWRHTYNNGILDGNYNKWHENGKQAVVGFIENGVPVGIWSWRDKEGKIIKKERFNKRTRGILHGFKEYKDKQIIH